MLPVRLKKRNLIFNYMSIKVTGNLESDSTKPFSTITDIFFAAFVTVNGDLGVRLTEFNKCNVYQNVK